MYAVRQGPVLARNLRAALGEGRPATYVPQRTFLSLLNTADGKALLRWHGIVSHSRFAWWLKDRIDRRFVRRYRAPRVSPSCAIAERALGWTPSFRAPLTEGGRRAMGRRALFWSGAVLVGLIVQQSAVRWFGADANRWLGVALVVVLLLSVPAVLLGSRVEGTEPMAPVARGAPARCEAPPELTRPSRSTRRRPALRSTSGAGGPARPRRGRGSAAST